MNEKPKPDRWRRTCLISIAISAIGILGTLFYPPWLFSESFVQMLPLAFLNIAMYVGPLVATVSGIGWAVRR